MMDRIIADPRYREVNRLLERYADLRLGGLDEEPDREAEADEDRGFSLGLVRVLLHLPEIRVG